MTDAKDQQTERDPAPTGSLASALERAEQLLHADASLAEQQAQEILKVVPGEPRAVLVLARAFRGQGKAEQSRDLLQKALARRTDWAEGHLELGLAHAATGRSLAAIKAFERALKLNPGLSNAWRALGDQFTLMGDGEAADRAYGRHIQSEVKDPALMNAGLALAEGRIAVAERACREYLKKHPTDIMAIRMLAEVAARIGRYGDAEVLLERCAELAPSFIAARHNLAIVRLRLNKAEEALREVRALLKSDPQNPSYRTLASAALVRVGEYDEAIRTYEKLLKEYPNQPKSWMSFGHALKTVGRTRDSVDAYLKCIEQAPHLGEAYWSLANLKTYRFDDASIAEMRAQLARSELAEEDRLHLHFALGKALEDAGAFEESFDQYTKGNAIGQRRVDYDEDETTLRLERMRATFTPGLFAARRGQGCPAPDPIFVLGMPRAGSTLIEQILSSHSLVEGTMELPDIMALVKRLADKATPDDESKYPEILESLTPEDLRALGEEYLERTRIQRKTARPYFVDKMPNNFPHVGFIRLILPNAKIIDARRHPLACCFSGFKQHFARGQNFSYGLGRIGRYYRDYVMLMKHFDEALPGAVHRVIYEELVAAPEREIRRMLGYCGLAFEPACLSFHETERPVRTASSEQVRQPIYDAGVDHWRNYDPWLGELKSALGPVLDRYPAAP